MDMDTIIITPNNNIIKNKLKPILRPTKYTTKKSIKISQAISQEFGNKYYGHEIFIHEIDILIHCLRKRLRSIDTIIMI